MYVKGRRRLCRGAGNNTLESVVGLSGGYGWMNMPCKLLIGLTGLKVAGDWSGFKDSLDNIGADLESNPA